MSASDLTVFGNLNQALGGAYSNDGGSVWLEFNTENKRVVDDAGVERIGAGAATLGSDGSVLISGIPKPGATNPTSFQCMIRYDLRPVLPARRNVTREKGNFGWMTLTGTTRTVTNKALTSNVATITVSEAHGLRVGDPVTISGVDSTFNGSFTITAVTATTVSYAKTAADVASTAATGTFYSSYMNLAVIEDEQAIPAEYQTTFTESMQAIADAADADRIAAEAARDAAVDISGISTSDAVVEALVKNTGGAGPLTSAALTASFATTLANPRSAASVVVRDEIADSALATNVMRQKWLSVSAFEIYSGAPAKTLYYSRTMAWKMRDSVSDRIAAVIGDLPQWEEVDIDLVWINPDATKSGDVAVRMYWGDHSVGDSTSTITNLNPTPALLHVPLSGAVYRTRIARRVAINRSMVPLLMVDRLGSDASDTLAGDIGFVGVIISPVTPYAEIAGDGAWCWFNEARLLGDETRSKMYAGYVTEGGSIGVASLDTGTSATASFTLHANLEADDHDTPGMTLLPDGNLIAFYSKHSVVNDPIYWRKTTTPGDVSTFGAEQTITLPSGGQPCYPKPAQIGTRLYLFFRNATNHDFIYSDDSGASWSSPATLFEWTTGWRGYVNMVQNGSRIDFLVNDDNPNTSGNTNLQHCYFEGGNLYKTDGTLIEALIGGGGITPAQMTRIYTWTEDGDAWGWDIQLDGTGKPRAVFATFPGAATASAADTDHHYKYAHWTGSAWVVTDVVHAGPSIADRGGEYRYSGGIALLGSDTSVVYTSRLIENQWEIERWETSDDGTTWTMVESVTRTSRDKQVRPTTPEQHFDGCPEVAWMSGWYVAFAARYSTRLVYRP